MFGFWLWIYYSIIKTKNVQQQESLETEQLIEKLIKMKKKALKMKKKQLKKSNK